MKFEELLNKIAINDPDLTYASVFLLEGSDDSKTFFSKKEIISLSLAISDNTYVTEWFPGMHSLCDKDNQPYIQFIDACIERNKQLNKKEIKFKNHFGTSFSTIAFKPLVFMAELGKNIFSYTIGLAPLFRFLTTKGPGRFNIELPTISLTTVQGSLGYRYLTGDNNYYPVIGISKNQYAGSYLAAPIVPFNYFARNLGKLVGVLLILPLLPLLTFTSFVKSIYTYAKEYKLNKEAMREANKNVENDIEKDKHQIIADSIAAIVTLKNETMIEIQMRKLVEKYSHNDVDKIEIISTIAKSAGESQSLLTYMSVADLYRDYGKHQEAIYFYEKINSDSSNYVEAMYEAGNCAIAVNDFVKAREFLNHALMAAQKNPDFDKEKLVDYNELLKNLPDDSNENNEKININKMEEQRTSSNDTKTSHVNTSTLFKVRREIPENFNTYKNLLPNQPISSIAPRKK